jgi:YkoY family integral membrane protein
MDLTFTTVILQLVFLECILSIDNAAVMGAMVASLPNDQPTPWPASLRRVFGWTDRLLGSQREAALKVGLFGAYAGRALMLALASIIIEMPWVHVLGAIYLLYLGAGYFAGRYRERQERAAGALLPRRKSGFWGIVLALNLADMAFSIDNVVAAVALSRHLWVVLLGVGVGILAIRFAATLFTRLIAWEPELEGGAYLLLLFIGAKLLLETGLGWEINDLAQFVISAILLLLTMLFARVRPLKPLLVIFRPFVALFAAIQVTIEMVVRGLTAPLRMLLPAKEEEPERVPESEPGIY